MAPALALALLAVLVLTSPAMAQNGAVTALAEPGSTPAQRGPTGLTVNAGWSATSTVPPAFFWSGTPPVRADDGFGSSACGDATCQFTFTLATDGCVSLTDDFDSGDQFRVYDGATVIGTTNLVPQGVSNPAGIGPDAAYTSSDYSSGTFVVGPGSYSLEVEIIPPNSLSIGRGYIRVDGPGNFTACDTLLGPDLVIDSITHDPASPDTEDTIEFTAVVKNIGFQSAGTSTLSFKIGGESPSDPDALFAVPSLVPGATATFTRNEGLSVAQNYLNTAVADFNDDVAEVDEGNNTATDSYTVTQAEEPSGVVYSLLTAPTNGDLYEEVDTAGDPVGSPLTDGSTILDPTSLHYFPDTGFEGTDMFTYRCTDVGTGLFDDATVDIIVSSPGTGVTLTVNFLGSGTGDVTLDVAGSVVAVCSSDCTEPFGPGDIVKLQARPIDLFNFDGWGGACSIGGSSQIVTITLPASGGSTCTATFNP
ncbi:MAG: CARDB domain-containing protein [Thermoanaerobaculia bacterium]